MVALGPMVVTDVNGTGYPGQDVILPGTFSPGHSPGTAVYAGLTLVDTSHLVMEIAGRDTSQYDHIGVTGEVVFEGTLDIRLLSGVMLRDGDSFDLFDWGTALGQFDTILLPVLDPGLAWDLSQLYVDGSVGVVDPPISSFTSFAPTQAVPAPAALALVSLGLAALAVTRRRRA